MQFDATLTGDDALIDAFTEKATALYEALFEEVNALDRELLAKAQAYASGTALPSGRRLEIRSGNLFGSIESVSAAADGEEIIGSVIAGGPSAPYAMFQEQGTQGPYPIAPVSKAALTFLLDGKRVFAKKVEHPGLEERSFLRSALDDMREEIRAGFEGTVRTVAA